MRKSYLIAILVILISTFTVKLHSQQNVGIYNSDLTIRDKGILGTGGEYPTKFMYYSEKGSIKMGALTSDTSNYKPSNFGWLNFDFGLDNNTPADYSFVHGGGHNTIGGLNFNSGANNEIEGTYNVSFISRNATNGHFNFLSGQRNGVEGNYNTIFGFENHSTAHFCFLLGNYLESQSAYSINLGRYNQSSGDTENWILSDHLFTVGNGNSDTERSNALTILKNGTLITNGHKLPGSDPLSQTLMFFDRTNAAFRAGGLIDGASWAQDSIGFFSTSFGINTVAKGYASFSAGHLAKSLGNYSNSFGYSSAATGEYSLAVGRNVDANASNSIALGRFNVGLGSSNNWNPKDPLLEIGNGSSSSVKSNAFTVLKNGTLIVNGHEIPEGSNGDRRLMFYNTVNGSFRGGQLLESSNWNTSNTGSNSFAYGFNSQASGTCSNSLGYSSIASGDFSNALGFNNYATASFASAFGAYTLAESTFSFVLGRYNIGGGDPVSWNDEDPLFEIGNGTDIVNRSNALTLRKNGRTILGKQVAALEDRLTVNSEATEHPFRIQADNSTKLRVFSNGSISMGSNNPNVSANDVYINNDLGIGSSTPEARLDVRGTSLIKMNSGSTNGPQLTLHETSTSDFARLDFTNDNIETKWTIAAKPESLIANSRFNVFLENVGNVLVATGDKKLGVGRTPAHPLHVGTDPLTGNGAHVTAGGTWTNGSSLTFKENFQKVNTAEILSALMGLDIQKWEYRGSNEGQHMGPIAEEFYEAFGLGNDEKYISTVDIDGVALAAIKALAKENEELRQRLDKLEKLLLQDRN